jgi:hypothetical protein
MLLSLPALHRRDSTSVQDYDQSIEVSFRTSGLIYADPFHLLTSFLLSYRSLSLRKYSGREKEVAIALHCSSLRRVRQWQRTSCSRVPISSFLRHRMSLPSAVKRGRVYEALCRQFLQSHLSMQLTMSGGAGDQGVDLRGSWKLYGIHDVIVQCKCYGRPVGPAVVREMEGTAAYYESGGRHSVLSVICAKSGFSEASWKRALSSRFPLLLLHLESEGKSSYAKVADQAEREDQAMCKGVWINTAFKQSTNDVLKVTQQYLVASGGIKRAIRINFRTVGDE